MSLIICLEQYNFYSDLILKRHPTVETERGRSYCRYTMTDMKQIAGVHLGACEADINSDKPIGFVEALLLRYREKAEELEKMKSGKDYQIELKEIILVDGQSSNARYCYGYGYTDKMFYIIHARLYCVDVSKLS